MPFMSASRYPTTLADLQLNSSSEARPSVYRAIRDIRKSALSVPNRLASILHDADFVQSVAARYQLPIVANERCGSWYIPPQLKAGSAYFKSTDGHHGQWDFSLRRLNLQLLDVLGREGGAVLVDSTRRGKSVPDALGKTVPVWVGVINRVLFPDREWGLEVLKGQDGLGESEVAQIEARMRGWVEGFQGLGVDVTGLRARLKKPIKVRWAINEGVERGDEGEEGWDMLDDVDMDAALDGETQEVNVLVLCSASRRVRGAEISEGGYIQGAGDDSEGWSHGLTPELFWANKDMLMESPEDDLPEIIHGLVEDRRAEGGEMKPVLVLKTKGLYIAACEGDGKDEATSVGHDFDFGLVINCNMTPSTTSLTTLNLACRTGKLGSRDLRDKLPAVKSLVTTTFERNPDCRVLITCATGRDLSVGVAVMLLCLFYNNTGAVGSTVQRHQIDKSLVKQRLSWISSAKPDANPSRSTLQSVNAFLMERP